LWIKLNKTKKLFFNTNIEFFCNFARVKTNELSNQLKQNKMKKALFLLAVATVFVACGGKTETPTETAVETPVQEEVVVETPTETPAVTPVQ